MLFNKNYLLELIRHLGFVGSLRATYHSECDHLSLQQKTADGRFFFQEMLTMLRFGLSVLLLSSVEVGYWMCFVCGEMDVPLSPSMVQCEIQTVKGVSTYSTFGGGGGKVQDKMVVIHLEWIYQVHPSTTYDMIHWESHRNESCVPTLCLVSWNAGDSQCRPACVVKSMPQLDPWVPYLGEIWGIFLQRCHPKSWKRHEKAEKHWGIRSFWDISILT